MDLTSDGLVLPAINGIRGPADGLAKVERELQQARAEAVGRTGERLQDILDRLIAQDRRLDALLAAPGASAGSDGLRSEVDIHNRLRDEALQIRQHLIIQREAVGFARHAPVEQCYPVPERRRLREPAGDPGRAR